MRALIQRVAEAGVTVAGRPVARIGPGLVVLACAMRGDLDDTPLRLARRIARLRIFRDAEGRMNRSVLETGGEVLVVSQFTLAADTRSGNRPGFSAAEAPARGEALYLRLVEALRAEGLRVATGQFGADMQVALVNDGPVTIWMDCDEEA